MKKLFLLISTLISISVFGQFPNTQSISNANTILQVPANGGFRAGIINRTFADTTAANATYLDYYAGAQIFTTSDTVMWYRDVSATKWIPLLSTAGSSSGGGGVYPYITQIAWGLFGNNIITSAIPFFGTKNRFPINIKTFDTVRLILDTFGLARSSSAANKFITFDTVTKKMYYGDGGTASSVPISSLTAATGGNTINNGNNSQFWQWNSYTGDGTTGGLVLSSSSTSVVASDPLFNINVSGGLGSGVTSLASKFSNTHTGTSSSNVAGWFESSGGTNNYALIVPSGGGNVGIGTSTPAKIFHTVGTIRHETLGTASSDTTTNKPLGINSSGDVIPMTYWPGGGGGGSPAGNFGNIQLNRNSAFATPGSDSLDFESSTGLSVKGKGSYTDSLTVSGGRLMVTTTNSDGVTSGAIVLSRTLADALYHHGVRDGTYFGSTTGYSAFDADLDYGNSVGGQDHIAGFQSRMEKVGNDNTIKQYDFFAGLTTVYAGGLLNKYGFYYTPATTSGGTIVNQYGVYVEPVTGATNNYGAYFGSNVGIGTATPSTPLHIINTTEQARIGYDASNYYKTTVGSTGGVTFDAVGSGANFTFSDAVTLGNLPSGSTSDSVLTDASGAVKHRKVSDLISPYVTTGTYTPTLSNTTNVSASTAYQCQYSVAADASGNQVVTVSGEVDIDPTTTVTLTVLRVTLPITSNVGQTYEIGGTANDELGTPARISGNVANDVAEIRFTPVDVTNRTFSFVFVYKVNIP